MKIEENVKQILRNIAHIHTENLEEKSKLLEEIEKIIEIYEKESKSETDGRFHKIEKPIEICKKIIELYEKLPKEKKDRIEKENDIINIYYLLAQYYFNNSDYQQMRKWLEKAIETYENTSKKGKERAREGIKGVYNNLATFYARQKQYKKAIDKYKEAIKNCGESKIFYDGLAYTYIEIGYYKEAIKYYKLSSDIEVDRDVYYNLGFVYHSLKKYKEAEKYYKKSIDYKLEKGQDDRERVYFQLAVINYEMEKYDEALDNLNKIEVKNENIFEVFNVYLYKILIYEKLKKKEEKKRILKKLCQELYKNKNDINYYYYKPYILYMMKKYDKAEKLIDEGIDKKSKDNEKSYNFSGVYFIKGKIYQRKNKLKDAVKYYEKIDERFKYYYYEDDFVELLKETFNNNIKNNDKNNLDEILNFIFRNKLYLSANILSILSEINVLDILEKEKKELIEKIKLTKEDFGDDDFNDENSIILEGSRDDGSDEDMSITLYMYKEISKNTIASLVNGGIYKGDPKYFNDPFDPYFKRYKNENSFVYDRLSKIRINCFTTENTNMLMWSHYGKNHEGICLGYEIKKSDLINVALKKVKYYGLKVAISNDENVTLENSNNSKKNNSGISDIRSDNPEKEGKLDDKKIVEKLDISEIFVRKSDEWEYENEYRLIYFDIDEADGYFEKVELKSITFGLHTFESDKILIQRILDNKDKYKNVEYYQIEEGNNLQLKRMSKEGYLKLGDEYKKNKELKKAKENYKKAIKLDSKYLIAYKKLMILYYFNKEYEKIRNIIDNMKKLNIPYRFSDKILKKLDKYLKR